MVFFFQRKRERERKYTGITVIQTVQFYGLFMWFADEWFYYCSFTTGFPSSKTSSMETLLTWATAMVRVHFYYNNKTLHAVTSRSLPSSRQTCSRRRFPPHFELLFCCKSLCSGAWRSQLTLSIYSSPFISYYVRLGTASSSGWTSLGGVHRSKSIVQSEILSRCRTPLISPLILHRHWCMLILGPPQETSFICCEPQTLGMYKYCIMIMSAWLDFNLLIRSFWSFPGPVSVVVHKPESNGVVGPTAVFANVFPNGEDQ